MDIAIIIPAINKNRYSDEGDLSAFGDTTLLEWKISQCKDLVESSKIYITSDCDKISKIAKLEEVNFIKRSTNSKNYTKILLEAVNEVSENNILWTNPSSPFITKNDYMGMINIFNSLDGFDSVVSVSEKKDYVFFKNNKLNFPNHIEARDRIEPIYILTNGCYLMSKENVLTLSSLYSKKPYLYKVDNLSSIEIKDIITYETSKELISLYFKKDLHV